jgi:hypothetical protein
LAGPRAESVVEAHSAAGCLSRGVVREGFSVIGMEFKFDIAKEWYKCEIQKNAGII